MSRITKTERRRRLIAMHECLRLAQRRLPDHPDKGTEFICHNIENISHKLASSEAKDDARKYVISALQGHFTFNCCITDLNPDLVIGPRKMMKLRRKFIDILCDRINIELTKF
jgi:hypothetical protein